MRCKVGDLCWIVRSRHPENIGRIVKVLRPDTDDGCEGFWWVEPQGDPLPAHYIRGGTEHTLASVGVIRDRDLLPIRPESSPAGIVERRELCE